MVISATSPRPTTSDQRWSFDSMPSARSSLTCSRRSGSALESYIDGLESPESEKSGLEKLLCFLMTMDTLLDQKDLKSKALRQKLLDQITEIYDGAIEGGSNLKIERKRILGLESQTPFEIKRELANTIHDKLLHTLSLEGPGSIPAELIKNLQELLKSAKEIEVKKPQDNSIQGNPETEEEFNNVLIALTGLIIILGFFTFSHSTYEFTKAVLALGIHQPTVHKTNSNYKNTENTPKSHENSEALQQDFWEKIKALFAEYQRLLRETEKADGKRKSENLSNIQEISSGNSAIANNGYYLLLTKYLSKVVESTDSYLKIAEENYRDSGYPLSTIGTSKQQDKQPQSENAQYNLFFDKNSTEMDAGGSQKGRSWSAPNSLQSREKVERPNVKNIHFSVPFLSQDASNKQQKNRKPNTSTLENDDSLLSQVGNDSGIVLHSSPILNQKEAIFAVNSKNTSGAFSDADSPVDKKEVAADLSDSARYIPSEEDSQIIPTLSIKNGELKEGSTSSFLIEKSNVVNPNDDVSVQLEAANQRFKQEKQGYKSRISFLKTKIEFLNRKNKYLNIKYKNLEQEIFTLNGMFDEKYAKFVQANAEDLCEEIKAKQSELEEVEQEKSDLKDQLATVKSKFEEVEQEKSDLKDELATTKFKFEAVGQERSRLQSALNKTKTLLDAEREKSSALELDKEVNANNNRIVDSLKARITELTRINREQTSLSERFQKEAESNFEKEKKDRLNLSRKNDRLKTELQEQKLELESKISKISDLESTLRGYGKNSSHRSIKKIVENTTASVNGENIYQKQDFKSGIGSIRGMSKSSMVNIDYPTIVKYIYASFGNEISTEQNIKIIKFQTLLGEKVERIFKYLLGLKKMYIDEKTNKEEFENARESANIFISMFHYYENNLYGTKEDDFHLGFRRKLKFYDFIESLGKSLKEIKFLEGIKDFDVDTIMETVDFWSKSEDLEKIEFLKRIADSDELDAINIVDIWLDKNKNIDNESCYRIKLEEFEGMLKAGKIEINDPYFANIILNILYYIQYYYEKKFNDLAINSIYIKYFHEKNLKEVRSQLTEFVKIYQRPSLSLENTVRSE